MEVDTIVTSPFSLPRVGFSKSVCDSVCFLFFFLFFLIDAAAKSIGVSGCFSRFFDFNYEICLEILAAIDPSFGSKELRDE